MNKISFLTFLILFFSINLFADTKLDSIFNKNVSFIKNTIGNRKVAVIGFNNSNKNSHDSFGALLNEEISNALIKALPGQVIAKNQLDKVLDELKISQDDTFDTNTRKQFGKLVSADILVTGTYRIGKKNITININVIDIERGTGLASHQFEIDKDLVPKDILVSYYQPKVKKVKVESESNVTFFNNVPTQSGFVLGWIGVPDPKIDGYDAKSSAFNVELILGWFNISWQIQGWDDESETNSGSYNNSSNENSNSDHTNALDLTLYIPIIDINSRYQLFLISGYRWEWIVNNYKRQVYPDVSNYFVNDRKETMNDYFIFGGAFRYMFAKWESSSIGLEFVVEQAVSQKKEIPSATIYKVNLGYFFTM